MKKLISIAIGAVVSASLLTSCTVETTTPTPAAATTTTTHTTETTAR